MAVQLILKNSSVADRRPAANQLSNGEIALNYNAAGAFLTCRDTDGSMQQVGGVKVAETAPSTPVKQTIWLKPSTNALSIYSGSSWVTIGAVTSVNGQAGAVTLTAANVGLGNVNNTSDLSKPISTATQNALDIKADLTGGKVPTSQLPSLAVSEYLGPAADQAAMLLLSGERGDWCIRTDSSSTFVLVTDGGSSIGDWQELATPASPVSSVNGFTGAVVLGASDVGAATAAQGATADSALQAGDNNSDLSNDSNYITSIEAPVQSVNTQTGAAVLDAADVGAVDLTGDNMTGDLTLGTNKITLDATGGSATFAGNALIGGTLPSAPNIELNADGILKTKNTIISQGPANGAIVFAGRNPSSNNTSLIFEDGSATLNGEVTIGAELSVIGKAQINKPSDFWNNGSYYDVSNGGSLATQGGFATHITSNGYRGASSQWVSLGVNNATGAAQVELTPTGYISFNTEANKATGSSSAVTRRMTIANDGNVGIGTTGPQQKLVISEPAGSSVGARMSFINEGDRGVVAGLVGHGASPNFAISNEDQTTDFVVVGVGGNVGISDASPVNKLTVKGTGAATTASVNISEFTSTIITDTAALNIGKVGTFPAIQSSGTNTAYHLLLNPLIGNVGIGLTSAPPSKLSLEKSTSLGISINRTGATPSTAEINNVGNVLQFSYNGNAISFLTGTTPTEAARFSSAGNMGIGNANPLERLDVTGNGKFSGTVSAQGSVLTSDQRFKENITDAKSQLADVTTLGNQLRNWDWSDDAPVKNKETRFLGLIAQEVETICPGLVTTITQTKQGAELTPETVVPAVYETQTVPAVLDDQGEVIKPETTEEVLVTEEEIMPATYEELDDSYKGIKNDVLIMKLLGAVAELSAEVDALKKNSAT